MYVHKKGEASPDLSAERGGKRRRGNGNGGGREGRREGGKGPLFVGSRGDSDSDSTY